MLVTGTASELWVRLRASKTGLPRPRPVLSWFSSDTSKTVPLFQFLWFHMWCLFCLFPGYTFGISVDPNMVDH